MFPIPKLVGPSDVHGSSTASLERAFLYSQEGRECASAISVSNLNKVSNFLFRLSSNKVYHSCLYASGSLIRTLGHNFPPYFFLETRDNSHVWPPTYIPFPPWPLIPLIRRSWTVLQLESVSNHRPLFLWAFTEIWGKMAIILPFKERWA